MSLRFAHGARMPSKRPLGLFVSFVVAMSTLTAVVTPTAGAATTKTKPAAKVSKKGATTPAPTPTTVPGQACTDPRVDTSTRWGGLTDGNYYVGNDMWNTPATPSSGVGSQTIHVCSHSSWYVVSDQPATSTVKTYPNVQESFKTVPVTKFTTLTSTFAESDPHVGIYEDAYDMWLNGVADSTDNEVMIWNENHGQWPSGHDVATVTLGGRTYTVWVTPYDRYIAFVATSDFTSGTLNLLQFYDWLMGRDWIPANSVVDQIDYGVEVCSTDSTPATFDFTNFSISATT